MTSLPATPEMTLESIFKGSWTLLRRNWTIVLPMLFITVAIFVFSALFALLGFASGAFTTTHPSSGSIAGLVVGCIMLAVLLIVVALWATGAVYGMANAAWGRGTATLGEGFTASSARLGPLSVAALGFVGAGIAAVILFIPTLGLVFLALPVVTMYVFPAVVCGGAGGFEAFRESWQLVRRYLGSSVVAILILIAVQYIGSIVLYIGMVPLEFALGATSTSNAGPSLAILLPLLGLLAVVSLVAILFAFGYAAYHALVIVGLYRWLHARRIAEDAAAAFVPPPLPPPAASPAPDGGMV